MKIKDFLKGIAALLFLGFLILLGGHCSLQ